MPSQSALITRGYAQTMARYNAVMNERLYAAAARLSDETRRADKGAFWKSIQGTLNHLLWADMLWMSRFDGWSRPGVVQKDSASLMPDFDTLARERVNVDAKIVDWANRLGETWLAGSVTWLSGSADREVAMPAALLLMHFFNHQTHHRGQAHALITAAGEATGDTDLFIAL